MLPLTLSKPQACLAEDYTTLAEVFQAVGFIDNPLQYRDDESQKFRTKGDIAGLTDVKLEEVRGRG